MTNQISRSEMPIPKPKGEIVATIVATTVIGIFVAVGVSNILNRVAIIASGIWLFLVGSVIWLWCRQGGTRKMLVSLLGNFASKHFVESIPRESQPADVRFGYQFLGHAFFYLTIPVDKVESISWSTGQGTSIAGRDMNDWSVALWYDHGDPVKSQQQQKLRKPDQKICIVGPSRRKELTADLGLAFVDFLRQAGASFVQAEDERHFVRLSAGGDPAGKS